MMSPLMQFKLLLPTETFTEKTDVLRVVADTTAGSYGFLPHRLDCAAALKPGILIVETERDGELFYAVDEGILVKTGLNMVVSVRRALIGSNLTELRQRVSAEFLVLNAQERTERQLKAKLESGFLKQFANFSHD